MRVKLKETLSSTEVLKIIVGTVLNFATCHMEGFIQLVIWAAYDCGDETSLLY